MKERK